LKIDPEDFESWSANPITQALMTCCCVWAEEAKQLWVSASWDGGVNKDTDLWRLKGQAEVLRDIQQLTAERIEETLK
jgi:hypothetical protein